MPCVIITEKCFACGIIFFKYIIRENDSPKSWEDVNGSGVADRLQKIVPCKHVAGGSWERRKGDGMGMCEQALGQ